MGETREGEFPRSRPTLPSFPPRTISPKHRSLLSERLEQATREATPSDTNRYYLVCVVLQ